MEQFEKVNTQKLYVSAIDYILKDSHNKSRENFNYLYNKVYKEHNGLSAFATQLQQEIEHKMQGKVDLNVVFNESFFTPQEKQSIVTYWVSTAILNETENEKKKLAESEEKPVDFHQLANEQNTIVRGIMSKKVFVDEKGIKYNGSDIFGRVEDTNNLKNINALNEFAVSSLLVGAAVYMVLGAASPAIAKTMPGVCEVVRNCAEKYPVATKIFDWFLSPFDLEAFIEQDKINKGEASEEGLQLQDDDEEIDADEVIMSDGSVVNVNSSNVNPELVIRNSSMQPKKEIRTFINANGQKQSYEFLDYDV